MWDETLHVWQDVDLHIRAFGGGLRFVKRMDLEPDVYLRETVGSLSRGSFQSREKLESRARVVKNAVDFLRLRHREDLVAELRYLCANVLFGALASGRMTLARDFRVWARLEGILTYSESARIALVEVLRRTRIDRFPSVNRLVVLLSRSFVTHSLIGKCRKEDRFDSNQAN
jgi:hypothetical protein